MPPPSKNNPSYLVVDDESAYRRLTSELLLWNEGYQARTAAQGLELYRRHKPDILFLDIGLPDKSGLLLLGEIKTIDPEAFIIMMTSSRVPEDVENARLCGACGYLVKPFNRSKLTGYVDLYYSYLDALKMLTPEERRKMHRKFFEKARALQEAMETVPETPVSQQNLRDELLASWRILLVDDDFGNRMRVGGCLEMLGMQYDAAANAQEALTLCAASRYDFILLEGALPAPGSPKLAVELRRKGVTCPIVVTANDEWEREDPKWHLGKVDNFIFKPVTGWMLEQLLQEYALKQIAAQQEPMVGG